MMATYGFKQEAIAKYDEEAFKAFASVLEWCPLGAVISTFVKCSEELEDAVNATVDEDADVRRDVWIPMFM